MNPSVPTLLLHRLFEAQAARTPEAVALIEDDGSTTYAELDSLSNRLAATIRSSGIRDGAFVGVHIQRSRHYVASLLGILKANGAVVPLPPSYPADRLRNTLAFAGLDAVLDDKATPVDPSMHDRIVHVEDAMEGLPTTSGTMGPDDPDRPAFVLCSSGSTDKPKMIVRSHRSFFHRLHWTWGAHPYAPGEMCCQKAHMTTTHAIYELFEPLLCGIPVHILSDQQARSLESFWEGIRRDAISRLLIVPSVLQASLDMPGFAPPALKLLVLMGESVHVGLATRAVAAFPETTKIYSIYGSTEASSTLVCDLQEAVRLGGEPPLGKPIAPEVHVRVLDAELEPVAAGAAGMLYVAGPALFSGYFRDAESTDAAFVSRGTERLYRTHDRVRLTAGGALQFLGRDDDTVKVRGFRVDLQEVERAIRLLPEVSQCAVIARTGGEGSASLAAFVAPASVRPTDVYRALRDRLPDYMLPARMIGLDTFPLTPSGKIDRRQLVEHSGSQPAAPAPRQALSATEQRLATVWADVLGHTDFDVVSHFFEVGGTSLKTFSVIARLRDAFGLERHQLPDDVVYRFPSIKALASCVDDACAGSAPAATPANSVLVSLKAAHGADVPPLFVIASAGGTLGAYDKLVRALATRREVIGVRDPYLWGKRDSGLGFQRWIALYLDAIRERQPHGPYHLVAYSSAGAFGYELARQLRLAREQVDLLALIDPLAIDRATKWRFGYWALEARFMRRGITPLVLAWGWFRRILPRLPGNGESASANDFVFSDTQLHELEDRALGSRQSIRQLSALLELNTGLPLALTFDEVATLQPTKCLDALLAKLRMAAPDVDTRMIERLVVQYALQVRSHQQYRLQPFEGTLQLFQPDGPYARLMSSLFMPRVGRLVEHRLPLSPPTARTRELAECFPEPMRSHYLSMRDDVFAQALARELDKLL